jgi:transaldolase
MYARQGCDSCFALRSRWRYDSPPTMKIFIDSAELSEIKEAAALGLIDGCTTNPSLLAKAGRKIETAIPEICDVVDGPVSAEVVATEYEAILKEGRFLAKLHKNVVVKVPLIADGLRAVRTFKKEGIRTNVTLCFSAAQAMLAAKAGAAYISPFIGRLDDVASEGIELIEHIVTIYRNYDYDTEVLTASVRSPLHIVQAALIGSHCATVPITVIRQLIKHPLTDAGLAKFLEDNKKAATAAK